MKEGGKIKVNLYFNRKKNEKNAILPTQMSPHPQCNEKISYGHAF